MQWDGEFQRSSGPGELRQDAAMAAESEAAHWEGATEFRREAYAQTEITEHTNLQTHMQVL